MLDEIDKEFDEQRKTHLRIAWDHDGNDINVYGTPEAYRRAADAILKSVEKPIRTKTGQTLANPDVDEFLTVDSTEWGIALHVVDILPPTLPMPHSEKSGSWFGYVFMAVIVTIVVLAAVGLGTIVNGVWGR